MVKDQESQKKEIVIISDPLPEKTKFPKSGFCNGRLRFNLLMNISVIGFIIIPFFVPVIYSIGIGYYFAFQWFIYFMVYLINSIRLMRAYKKQMRKGQKIQNHQNEDINSTHTNLIDSENNTIIDQTEQKYKYKQIMMTFIYKEPIQLLSNTLCNLREMEGSNQFIVAVGFEERSPDIESKIKYLNQQFSEAFEEFIITIHPYGTEGEIPGKCSNSNYLQRKLVAYLEQTRENFNLEGYMVTNFDTDSRFQKNYLRVLESQMQKVCKKPEDIHEIVWQPVIYYNWDLKARRFFVRIISLVRNMLMMGALIPFQINVMGIFSFSLKLCVTGGYTHPTYQMDDVICQIRWFIKKKKPIKIKQLYTAAISGPTTGNSFYEELVEWARQIKRWTIGTAEVFHYYVVKSKHIQPNLKFTIWGFLYFNYYSVFLIAQNFFTISCAVCFTVLKSDEISDLEFYLSLGPLGFQYVIFIFMFIINGASQYILDPIRKKESFNIILTLIHIIITPLTQIASGFVACYGIFEVAFRGKKVCNHISSKKDTLK
ncbi:hypothetical protein ABPG72_012159 [Tetrahymena utriculariae]